MTRRARQAASLAWPPIYCIHVMLHDKHLMHQQVDTMQVACTLRCCARCCLLSALISHECSAVLCCVWVVYPSAYSPALAVFRWHEGRDTVWLSDAVTDTVIVLDAELEGFYDVYSDEFVDSVDPMSRTGSSRGVQARS